MAALSGFIVMCNDRYGHDCKDGAPVTTWWRPWICRPTDSMFVFDTCPPFRELLHPSMDCLMWQAMFNVHGQHFFMDILCCHTFAHKNRTTPRCSIVVHVFRGAAIL